MAQISITIPDDKITEIVDLAKSEGLVTDKSNNQIIRDMMRDSLKAYYRAAKQRALLNQGEELDI